MKPHYINSDIKLPERNGMHKIKNVTSVHRVNKNIAEFKNGIVLYLHFDGIQIVDILRYLRENSMMENIRSFDSAIQLPDNETFFSGTEITHGLRIDEETYITWREYEIMERLLKGWLNKEIADDLGLGYNTVRNNLQRIYRKFKVSNRSEAILHYLEIRDKLKLVSTGA
jgi:DNA-binding NarL/FixJ family response regulator